MQELKGYPKSYKIETLRISGDLPTCSLRLSEDLETEWTSGDTADSVEETSMVQQRRRPQ